MFRYYFIENGRISWGDDLKASTLAEAIELAQDLRQTSLKSDKAPGIEIWQGASFLFQDVHDADRIQGCAPIISPPFLIALALVAAWLGVSCTLAHQSGPLLHVSSQNQDPLYENSVVCLLLQRGRAPGRDGINPLSMGGTSSRRNCADARLV
jgi:hypothetical protein